VSSAWLHSGGIGFQKSHLLVLVLILSLSQAAKMQSLP
jgi:hypothetical protein